MRITLLRVVFGRIDFARVIKVFQDVAGCLQFISGDVGTFKLF